MVPSDQTPAGSSLPAAASVPKSLAASRDRSDILYAYSLPSSPSATHIVVPSDQMPRGLSLPAATSVPKSLPESRALSCVL